MQPRAEARNASIRSTAVPPPACSMGGGSVDAPDRAAGFGAVAAETEANTSAPAGAVANARGASPREAGMTASSRRPPARTSDAGPSTKERNAAAGAFAPRPARRREVNTSRTKFSALGKRVSAIKKRKPHREAGPATSEDLAPSARISSTAASGATPRSTARK